MTSLGESLKWILRRRCPRLSAHESFAVGTACPAILTAMSRVAVMRVQLYDFTSLKLSFLCPVFVDKCSDHFRITVEPVIVKRYRKTLANRGFYKKKLDTRFDTHCIKTGVQFWWGWRGSNPRPPRCERGALTGWATSPSAYMILHHAHGFCKSQF